MTQPRLRPNDANRLSRYMTHVRLYDNGKLKTVTYHDTDIVSVDEKGNVTLNSGGYMSVTTKKKINQSINEFKLFGGYHVGVFQKRGYWFISKSNLFNTAWNGDAIVLNPCGEVIGYQCALEPQEHVA